MQRSTAAEPNDSECVKKVLDGEPNAFNVLVFRYQSRIFSMLLMMTRDKAAAEDVSQEAFMKAYSKLATYDAQRAFYPWLATIAARIGLNWLSRIQPNRIRETTNVDVATIHEQQIDQPERIEEEQHSQQLWKLVSQLSQGERTAVLLFYKQELRVNEIASILGVTEGTVKTFLHRGRSRLKEQLRFAGEQS